MPIVLYPHETIRSVGMVPPSKNLETLRSQKISEGHLMYTIGHERLVDFELGYSSPKGRRTFYKKDLYIQFGAHADEKAVIDMAMVTTQPIDLTGRSYVVCRMHQRTMDIYWNCLSCHIIASKNKMGPHTDYDARVDGGNMLNWDVTAKLDVSALTGSYYIRIHLYWDTASTAQHKDSDLMLFGMYLE